MIIIWLKTKRNSTDDDHDTNFMSNSYTEISNLKISPRNIRAALREITTFPQIRPQSVQLSNSNKNSRFVPLP